MTPVPAFDPVDLPRLREPQIAVIIAVIVVRMMQTPIDEIVGVACVRDRLVPAIRAVTMLAGVTTGPLGTTVGVARTDGDDVLIDMILMGMMQVPVVQVIGVAVMHDRRMPAPRTVNVVMRFVNVVIVMAHGGSVGRAVALDQSDARDRQSRTTGRATRGDARGRVVDVSESTTSLRSRSPLKSVPTGCFRSCCEVRGNLP